MSELDWFCFHVAHLLAMRLADEPIEVADCQPAQWWARHVDQWLHDGADDDGS